MLDTIAMAKQLKGEYQKVFETASMYSMISSENEEADDEKIMNIYDMLIEAQNNEKPVEKIVGTDVEAFCKEYFKANEEEVEKWYIRVPKKFYVIFKAVMLGTLLLSIFPEEGVKWYVSPINVIPYIGGLILGCVMLFLSNIVLDKLIFKSKIKPIWFSGLILTFYVGSIILIGELSGDYAIEVPVIWLLGIPGCYIIVYLLVRSIWRYCTQGTIWEDTKENRQKKKAEKEEKELFNEEVSREANLNLILKYMVTRYNKLNKKNIRKKKQELSFTEYAEKIRKEEHLGNILSPICCGGILIASMVQQIITSGVVAGLQYAIVSGIIGYGVYRVIKSINEDNTKQRLHILEECENRGIGIQEYAQEISERNDLK